MNRRHFLAAGAVLATVGQRAGAIEADDGLTRLWPSWKARFLLPEGRVVDQGQGGISHSEGQGYGLLLAQAAGDAATFRQIEDWTARHLAIRQDALMGWKWQAEAGGRVSGWHNATDGDLFRAWALLRAGRDSGWTGFEAQAVRIARDIAGICLAPDPRAPQEWLLRPGAEARQDAGRVLLNPSYFMPRALRELGEECGEPRLIRAADHAETVLAELADQGFLPDWIDRTDAGFAPPADHDLRWGYDAVRIPLYLIWSGRAGHPAVAVAAALMDRADLAGHLALRVSPEGVVGAESDHPGYRAIWALIDCARAEPAADEPYYPATLGLLARLAVRESDCGGERETIKR